MGKNCQYKGVGRGHFWKITNWKQDGVKIQVH